jgi:hypothetical protein
LQQKILSIQLAKKSKRYITYTLISLATFNDMDEGPKLVTQDYNPTK